MHILYLHQYYCPEGGWGNNRSYDFARYWVAAGMRVSVVTSTAYFPPDHPAHRQPTYSFEENGVAVHVLRVPYQQALPPLKKAWAFVRFYRRLLKTCKEQFDDDRPTLLYASSTPPTVGEAGRKLALRWGVPFVFETVDVWPDVPIGMGVVKNPLLIRWLQGRVNRMYHAAEAVVPLSPGMAAQVASHGVARDKIWTVPNGTDTTLFVPAPSLPAGPVRIMHTGTAGRVNGVYLLLEAAALLQARELPPWEIVLLGGGSEWEALKAHAQQLGLANVHFRPAIPKSEMPAFLQTAHIGAMTVAPYPVLQHNSANKWYDYLAAGLPIALNYEGWQADVLAKSHAGLSAPMGDTPAFAENLATLIQNAELRKTMGQNGRVLAQEQYDRRVLALNLLNRLQTRLQH